MILFYLYFITPKKCQSYKCITDSNTFLYVTEIKIVSEGFILNYT